MRKTTDQLLLAALRTALWGNSLEVEAFAALSAEEWTILYKQSAEQGVLALVYDAIQSLPKEVQPPRGVRLQWAVNVERIEKRYAQQERAIAALASFCQEHNLPLMLLKGYGLSRNYPIPHHRPCGDIDIWLYGRQAEADRLLRDERGVRIDEDKHHHTVFTFEGVMVENHFDFLNVHAHRSNRVVEARLQELAGEGDEVIEVQGTQVCLPSPDFNALFLLRHAAAHFAAVEIGLRHVLDWALFIHHYHDRIHWTALEEMARAMNMHRFLYAMQGLAVDELGVSSEKLPHFERDEALQERVLQEILNPEFSAPAPARNPLKIVWYRFRRWWANRWKHRMVYSEGLFSTFWVQVWSHLLKPKSIIH